MFFQRVKTRGIAHVSYVLGDVGEAIVVAPRRDTEAYSTLARNEGLRVRYVLETHRQEDFVVGSAALAADLGAQVVTLNHPLFKHSHIRLSDHQAVELAGMRVKALHTPGHTPESTCFAVYLPGMDVPWGVFTGDTLFVGETGRTDLTDRTRTGENAGLLYDAVHAKLVPLGPHTLLWPAHGSGSACGGNIAPRDDSTLGLEAGYNPVFTEGRDAFVARKIRERIPRPPYFRTMETWNLQGNRIPVRAPAAVPVLRARDFAHASKEALVLDTRTPEAFASGHIPGSVNVWLEGLPVFAGWIADERTRICLVLSRPDDLPEVLLHLGRVGFDHVEATLADGFDGWRDAAMPLARSGTLSPTALHHDLASYAVLDVRDDHEFEAGHIPGAWHLYVGYLDAELERIRSALGDKPGIAVVCSVGHRASLAVSLLQRQGFRAASNVLGGMTAWSALGLPQSQGSARSVTTPDVEGTRK